VVAQAVSNARGKIIGRMPSLHHEHESYKWWVLANIMIGTFMAVLDATIVNVALPKIMATFGIAVDKVEWVATGYLLVFAVMLPSSAWLADHFGYKRTYMLGLFLFTLGSFLCGVAWDENILIAFRIVQGLGGGLLMPVGMAIVTREFPPEKRGVALGFWTISAAASVSLGPVIGGYLIDNFAWHSVFDVNVPVGIFGIVATVIILREYKVEETRSFDLVGFLSVGVFLTFLLLALADGNASWNTGGWTSPFILSCFTLSAVALIVFLITEFTVRHPLIELRLLKDYNFAFTNIAFFIFGLGIFGSSFLLPLFLQDTLGYTAFEAGMFFLPVGIIQGSIAPIAGYLSDKINPKIPAFTGMVLLALSLGLNYLLSLYSDHAQIMLPFYIRGIAIGMIFAPLSVLALYDIPRPKLGQASGLFNVIRQVGGSLGVAIFGTILTRRQLLHMQLYSESVHQQSIPYTQAVTKLQWFARDAVGGTTQQTLAQAKALVGRHVAQQAFVSAVNDDFLIAGVVTAVSAILILMLKSHKRKGAEPVAIAD
jgi:MFS transporter, DHA2 family, multidrug resistance protein